MPLQAVDQLCPGHVADCAHRQDHHAERLRESRHGVQSVDWHALRGPLSHQPCARQLLSHPDDRSQGEEAAAGHQILAPKPINRSPSLSSFQDKVASAADSDQQPQPHHVQKTKRARLPRVYPDSADMLRELTLAPTPAPRPGQAISPRRKTQASQQLSPVVRWDGTRHCVQAADSTNHLWDGPPGLSMEPQDNFTPLTTTTTTTTTTKPKEKFC